jgi:hypothetical protein
MLHLCATGGMRWCSFYQIQLHGLDKYIGHSFMKVPELGLSEHKLFLIFKTDEM